MLEAFVTLSFLGLAALITYMLYITPDPRRHR
jgi:hypothetical protein